MKIRNLAASAIACLLIMSTASSCDDGEDGWAPMYWRESGDVNADLPLEETTVKVDPEGETLSYLCKNFRGIGIVGTNPKFDRRTDDGVSLDGFYTVSSQVDRLIVAFERNTTGKERVFDLTVKGEGPNSYTFHFIQSEI